MLPQQCRVLRVSPCPLRSILRATHTRGTSVLPPTAVRAYSVPPAAHFAVLRYPQASTIYRCNTIVAHISRPIPCIVCVARLQTHTVAHQKKVTALHKKPHIRIEHCSHTYDTYALYTRNTLSTDFRCLIRDSAYINILHIHMHIL